MIPLLDHCFYIALFLGCNFMAVWLQRTDHNRTKDSKDVLIPTGTLLCLVTAALRSKEGQEPQPQTKKIST